MKNWGEKEERRGGRDTRIDPGRDSLFQGRTGGMEKSSVPPGGRKGHLFGTGKPQGWRVKKSDLAQEKSGG